MASILDKLNAGVQGGTLFDEVKTKKEDTTLAEDIVDISRGATNQLGLMPVAQGVTHALLDPITTRLGGKGTADSNIDLSDKNFLERTLERFKYGYNTNKEAQKESEERNPLAYNLANLAVGFATPAGAIGNLATKPVGTALSKVPVAGKVGNALTQKGLTKTVVDNAIEGAVGGAGFAEEGNEGSNALIAGSIGAGVPLAGKLLKKATPLIGWGAGGANLKDANLYSKNYSEIAKNLENATKKFDDIEKSIETNVSELNTKYDSAIHDIGTRMANNTEKIVQEQDNLANSVRNKLIEAYNDVDDKIMQSSYKARGNLRNDAFVDVTGIQKELDDIIKESKIQGKSYSASNDTSMKTVEQIRDDLYEIAKEGKISEKDLWRYMHDVLNPLAKYSNKELKGYTPPSVAVSRIMRHKVDDLLKTANPSYQKAMKPTAEMAAFLRKELPEVINLDNASSLNIIKNIRSNPEGLRAITKLSKYAGTKFNDNLRRLVNIEKKLPVSFIGKDNLQITGILNKQGEGLTVEQIQKTLKNYDDINGTKFSEQWNKARKEGKRDSIEALTELREISKLNDTDKKGMSYLGKAWTGYNPDKVTGNQTFIERIIEGNEANPLNTKLAKDKKAIKATDLIADLTGMDKKELEKFARSLSLDKALDTSSTNGSRNVRLLGALGGIGGATLDLTSSDKEYDPTKNPLGQILPIKGGTIGAALGTVLGGVRDYGAGNRIFKELVKLQNKNPAVMERISEYLNRAATRSEGIKEYNKTKQNQAERDVTNYQANLERMRMEQDPVMNLRLMVSEQQDKNLKNFGRY